MSNTRSYSFKLLFLGFLVLLWSCKDEKQAYEAGPNQRIDSLLLVLQQERAEKDSLKRALNDSATQSVAPVLFGADFSHIENPEKYVKNELQKKKENIPIKGVLGGTMKIREMEVLSDQWIFAVYDDGHIQGKSIYEYKLQSNDSVTFSIIISDHPRD